MSSGYYTRSKHAKLLQTYQEQTNIRCRSDDCTLYGYRHSLFLCWQCYWKQNIDSVDLMKKTLHNSDICIAIQDHAHILWKAAKSVQTPYESARLLCRMYHILVDTEYNGKLFVLSYADGSKLMSQIRNKHGVNSPNMHEVSHVIARIMLEPWRIDHENGFHNLSLRYFGNMGKVPKDTETATRVLLQCKSVYLQKDGFGWDM